MKRTTIKTWGTILAIIAGLGAVVAILLYLMHGNTVTTNDEMAPISNDALSCTSDKISYPIFTYDSSDRKELKVDLIFAGDKLRTIALSYTLYYGDENSITVSEAINHADMNLSFYSSGLGSDALNAKYSKLSDALRFGLYAHDSDMNRVTARYFMVKVGDHDDLPDTIMEYRRNYEEQGLACVITE